MEDIFENIKNDVKGPQDMAALYIKDIIEHTLTNVSGIRYITYLNDCIKLEKTEIIKYYNTNDAKHIELFFSIYTYLYEEEKKKTYKTYRASHISLYKAFKMNMNAILNEYKNYIKN